MYSVSLAQWSIHKLLFAGQIRPVEFAEVATRLGIHAIEYVTLFFKDKAADREFLQELNARASGEGVTQVLLMVDNEGHLGDPDDAKRTAAVENHYKWIEAAAVLGAATVRVNGFSRGSPEEQMHLVADGVRRLTEFADTHGINIAIENHGGLTSHATWLVQTLALVNHPRAGTLPDFGNFVISHPTRENPDAPLHTYDSYAGVAEMMPLAKGVSVKTTVFDSHGNSSEIDLRRMMRIVTDAGYHGYVGIEHGREGREFEDIAELRADLERVRDELAAP